LWPTLGRIPPPILAFLGVLALVNVFVLAAFIYFVFRARVPVELRVFAALLVLYAALITGSIGASRYRLVVEAILLLGVPFFVKRLCERRRGNLQASVSDV
jgi:hypothetical protein